MIAGFKTWTTNIYARVRRVHAVVRTPANSGLTLRQQDTGRKALKILGIEESDGINKQELVIFLYAVGLNPTDDVIDSKLRAFKLHDLEQFTFGHVCHIWHSMLQDLTDEEEILRRAFQFFDKDGNGEISIPELRTTMHELGDLLSEEEILAFMAVMDVNKDGVIGFEEFIGTLKTQTPELIQADHAGDDEETASSPHREEAERRADQLDEASHTLISMDQSSWPPRGRPEAVTQLSMGPVSHHTGHQTGHQTGQPLSESICDPVTGISGCRSAPNAVSQAVQTPASLDCMSSSLEQPGCIKKQPSLLPSSTSALSINAHNNMHTRNMVFIPTSSPKKGRSLSLAKDCHEGLNGLHANGFSSVIPTAGMGSA